MQRCSSTPNKEAGRRSMACSCWSVRRRLFVLLLCFDGGRARLCAPKTSRYEKLTLRFCVQYATSQPTGWSTFRSLRKYPESSCCERATATESGAQGADSFRPIFLDTCEFPSYSREAELLLDHARRLGRSNGPGVMAKGTRYGYQGHDGCCSRTVAAAAFR